MVDDNKPVVTSSLDELISSGVVPGKKIGILVGRNMGNRTLSIAAPMHEFFDMSEVANERGLASHVNFAGMEVAQRRLDPAHAKGIAVYILKGLLATVAARHADQKTEPPRKLPEIQEALGIKPYLAMQPITANIRTCGSAGSGLSFEGSKGGQIFVYLAEKDVLWVVDGQHRRHAMDMLFDWLRQILATHRYPKKPRLYGTDGGEIGTDELAVWAEVFEVARTTCTVLVEVHLGLDPDQERQLFHDLNNLTKKVEAGLAFQFDSSNPVNMFIKEQLIADRVIQAKVVERDVVDWHDDPGQIARKDLVAVNALLFLNKTNINGATPQDVAEKREVAIRFWTAVNNIPGFGEPEAKKKTVAAQPVVLKALAKLAYDFGYGRSPDAEALEKLLEGIPEINFSHEEPMWRYYELSDEQRRQCRLTGLEQYLPSDKEGANRDLGAFDENAKTKVMRFGAKHNDIFPILGDMIRWRLGLPKREHNKPSKKEATV